MKTSFVLIAFGFFLVAGQAHARQEKSLVCHVGNELGSQGETWLENPNCEVPEGWVGEYTCPDAGKVDLILVAKAAKHLGNENHSWDGLSDYDPFAVGASGDSTEDANGDGIDDGCEVPTAVTCPCWDEQDLMVVTAENQLSFTSCSDVNPNFAYPAGAIIQNVPGSTPDLEGGFAAYNLFWNAELLRGCQTREQWTRNIGVVPTTEQEAAVCIDQIAARCAAIGDSIFQ